MSREPSPMNGKLIQKIHTHDTFWAKPPPNSGPLTVPIVHQNRLTWKDVWNLTDGPSGRNETEPGTSHPQRHHVCDDDLGECDHSSAANALNRPADQNDGEVLCDRRDDGTDSEKGQTDEEDGFPPKDTAERAQDGLEHCTCQEERSARPERLNGAAAEFLSNDGQGDGKGGRVERNHECDGGQGQEG